MAATTTPTKAVAPTTLLAAPPVKGSVPASPVCVGGVVGGETLVALVPLVALGADEVRTKLAQLSRVALRVCTTMERLPMKAPGPECRAI